jgi:hypothetical protein
MTDLQITSSTGWVANVTSHTSSKPFRHEPSGSGLLLAFILIGSVFVASNSVTLYRAHEIERGSHVIIEEMLTSVELVSRMARDLSRERRLVDAHIIEQRAAAMADIEAQIGDLESDFSKAAVAYEPLTTSPGELVAWRRLQANLQAIRAPIAETIALSRRNEDVGARNFFRELDARFDEITEEFDDLIRINREDAEGHVQQIADLQRSEARILTILTFTGILFAIIVG